jgi:hypothetical protein
VVSVRYGCLVSLVAWRCDQLPLGHMISMLCDLFFFPYWFCLWVLLGCSVDVLQGEATGSKNKLNIL